MKEPNKKIKIFFKFIFIFIQILFYNIGFFKLCKDNFINEQNLNIKYVKIKFFILPIMIFIVSVLIFELFLNKTEYISNQINEKIIKLKINKNNLLLDINKEIDI